METDLPTATKSRPSIARRLKRDSRANRSGWSDRLFRVPGNHPSAGCMVRYKGWSRLACVQSLLLDLPPWVRLSFIIEPSQIRVQQSNSHLLNSALSLTYRRLSAEDGLQSTGDQYCAATFSFLASRSVWAINRFISFLYILYIGQYMRTAPFIASFYRIDPGEEDHYPVRANFCF